MKSWPRLPLAEVAPIVRRPVVINPEQTYPELGIRSFGKGAFHKPALSGAEVGSKRLFEIHPGDLIFSNIFAWEGAVAVASPDDKNRFGSHRFITCMVDPSRAMARFLQGYLTASDEGLEQIRRASPGGAGRNRTLGIEKLGRILVPVPPLEVQQALIARLDALAEKTRQVDVHLESVERDATLLLALRFRDAIDRAPMLPMAKVAPLARREISIDQEENYTELGVRSFYKGSFHRRSISGSEFSWQDLYRVRSGDLIFSNIMAWEQAIAIAKLEDDGCVGNHRMLTCEAEPDLAVPGFLWYYFYTPEGFEKIYAASPGTAARNRTMTASALMAIEVPVPPLSTQKAFERLQAEVAALKAKHTAIRQSNAALLPAMLERVFASV
jgi:restriction endonuclease S subunit